MTRTDRPICSPALKLAGVCLQLAGSLAAAKSSACNHPNSPATREEPAIAGYLQALQAPHVGVRGQAGERAGAGGGAQGRAGARVRARVQASATREKVWRDNHLELAAAAVGICNHGCSACSRCNACNRSAA